MKIKTCIPEDLPLRGLKWERFVDLMGKAHAAIARYDEALLHAPHRKELVGHLKIRTFSLALLCKLHHSIEEKIKGKKGKFRTSQNWIGPEGEGIEEGYFFPPDIKTLHQSMRNLKKYLSYPEKDPLVQLAIFFAQFLIIHPFLDGNGRVARAFTPLFLYKKKLISYPLFYSGSYFRRHRLKYFTTLYEITTKQKWEEWIRFFLKGVIEEAEISMAIVQKRSGHR